AIEDREVDVARRPARWPVVAVALCFALTGFCVGRLAPPGTGYRESASPDARQISVIDPQAHSAPTASGLPDLPAGGPPGPVPGSGRSFAYLEMQQDGLGGSVPVTWSSCRPVQVVVNPLGAPEGFADRVAAELSVLAGYSGLDLVLEGTTDEPPSIDRASYQPDRYGDRWAPALIAVTTPEQVSELAGEVVGVARSATSLDEASGVRVRVSGMVYLDVDTLVAADVDGSPMYAAVLRHELGHLLGLAHVEDEHQLMNPAITQSVYRNGDLEGLAALGAGPCVPGR
ncbi:MAG TPA: matrixin family metalloprotease, partial [Actinotalea sp.]|nr:matrixin family metalloprotease [Actinotalea sp.]